ncbi:arylamine N-acetyltransferase [Pseudohyphozyma bogoriensis]|nr:arylamine N-acetyltransferase [Pseudohyphozyma bogoriensis]
MVMPLTPYFARPEQSIYFSTLLPDSLAIHSLRDTIQFLIRLNLPPTTVEQPPSLELLSKLLLAAHLEVPFDSSCLHVSADEWLGENKEIVLGKGGGSMQLGEGNFNRIVKKHQGGFCYAIHTNFAAFLRGFGFVRGKDPKDSGYWWSAISHELLIVDWQGSEGRYMCDCGFGGGASPYPTLLKDGQTGPSLSKNESFMLRQEHLPVDEKQYVVPSSPVQATQNLDPMDITMQNFYNEAHPNAFFQTFFVVSRLLPSGARRTISYPTSDTGDKDKPQAKLYTKEGINGVEFDVEFVDFETEKVREVLRREFGFKFE